MDYYSILGVSSEAEDIVIRAAYKALAHRYHPDRNIGNASEAQEKMALINEAYSILSDPNKRKEYDLRNTKFDNASQDNKRKNNNNKESFQQSENIPDGVKGTSIAAFMLTIFWSIGNRVWIGIFSLIPLIGIIISIYLGFKGRELAWNAKSWKNLDHFKSVQRKWNIAAIILIPASIGIHAAIAIPAYQAYVQKAKEAASSTQEPPSYISSRGTPAPPVETTSEPLQSNQIETGNIKFQWGQQAIFTGIIKSNIHRDQYATKYLYLQLDRTIDIVDDTKRIKPEYHVTTLGLQHSESLNDTKENQRVMVTCARLADWSDIPEAQAYCVKPQLRLLQADISDNLKWSPSAIELNECVNESIKGNAKDPLLHCGCILKNAAIIFDDYPDWLAQKFLARANVIYKNSNLDAIAEKCGPIYFYKQNNMVKSSIPETSNSELKDIIEESFIPGIPNIYTALKVAEQNRCRNGESTLVEHAAEYVSAYDWNCPDRSILKIRCKSNGCFAIERIKPNL